MKLKDLVSSTLKKNGFDKDSTSRIVATLINAGYSHEINKSQVKSVCSIVKSQATIVASIQNPLKVTSAFHHRQDGLCPYCSKVMQEVSIAGDEIKRARVCLEDRLILPI